MESRPDRDEAIEYVVYTLAAVRCWVDQNPNAEVTPFDLLAFEMADPNIVPQYILNNREVLAPIATEAVDNLITYYSKTPPALAN